MNVKRRGFYFGIIIGVFLICVIIFIVNFVPNHLSSQKEVPESWQEFVKKESWQFHGVCSVTTSEVSSELTGFQATGSLSYDSTQNGYALQCSFSYRNALLLSIQCYLDKEELIVKIPSLSAGIYKGNPTAVFNEAFDKITTARFGDISEKPEDTGTDRITFQTLSSTPEGYDGVTITIQLDKAVSFQFYWKGSLSGQYHYALEDAYIVWNDEVLFHLSGAFDLDEFDASLPKPTGTEHAFWDLLDLWDWRKS